MSDVTNEHLDLLERALVAIENDYRPTCISSNYGNGCAGATAESTEFWRRAADCTQAMITEIRARRAADISAEEREALITAKAIVQGALDQAREKFNLSESTFNPYVVLALAVLDRLIAGTT